MCLDGNDEIQMTKLETMTIDQMSNDSDPVSSSFDIRASFVIRHSCFVIFSLLNLMVATAAMTRAENMNLIGKWNVEITFGEGSQRALHFEAQDAGKGTFQVVDPRLKVWGPGKSSEAKWTREDQNAVTFTGPVEFMLGNVGRDAGTLTFKGKFEGADLITGEVDFSPLVGDRPSKHGTFKASRAHG
jgi:hypothetical protein